MGYASRKRPIVVYVTLLVVLLFHEFQLMSDPSTAIVLLADKVSLPSSEISEQTSQKGKFVPPKKVEGDTHSMDRTGEEFTSKSTSLLRHDMLPVSSEQVIQKKMVDSSRIDSSFPIVTDFTFPSVEKRITYYMGSHWSNESMSGLEKKDLPSSIECSPDLYQPASKAVLKVNEITKSKSDIARKYFARITPFLDAMKKNDSRSALLIKLGDGAMEADYPFVMKSREARPNSQKEAIILPLNFYRHYGEVLKLKQEGVVRWENKSEAILWRGSTTGPSGCSRYGKNKLGRSCDRLGLVRKYYNVTRHGSTNIDIGFSNLVHVGPDIKQEVEKYYKKRYDIKSMLQYKYLISVEGNDVATDLKWKLYSDSVVFMKPPTKVTWAMEDMLVPFYHYIPLADDYSDLFEKLDWAKEHQEECKKIARQSTKYIEALVASDQAVQDESVILTSIFKSYQNRYGHFLYEKCREKSSKHKSYINSSFVFPSVNERISYYMGSHWSNQSIVGLEKDLPPTVECFPSSYRPDSQAVLQVDNIKSSKKDFMQRYFARLSPLLDGNDPQFSLLVKLGDGGMNAGFPFVMKSRAARPHVGKEAILLPLNFYRHYGEVFKLKRENGTIATPWNKKYDAVVWRGSTTGPPGCSRYGKSKSGSCDRLKLVRKYGKVARHGRTKIDIGFSNLVHVGPDVKREAEKYYKKWYDMKSMLQYKYLISVEGNDVASDLKWKLYSNSVVFMKPPTKVTWAMEDKLVPFYHYIPLADDFSDLFEKLEWAKEHQEECKKIAHQSTLYIEALVTSDQATTDEYLILTSIFKSYQTRFGHFLFEKCKLQIFYKWPRE